MSIFPSQQKQLRPSQVQTNIETTQASTSLPISAKSASSVGSSSQQGSPIMSPDTAVLTNSSSIQASPESVRELDEDQCPPNFQLPESIVSRKTSCNSLGQSLMNHSSAIPETPGTGVAPSTTNQKSSLIRRISSRASRRLTTGRRQSSAAPTSRDASVGPCLLRRRSDSNTTAPPDFPPVAVESESDADEREEARLFRAVGGHDASIRSASTAGSTTDSAAEEPNTMDAPTVPPGLQRGTWVVKVSKKSRPKRVCLVYDPDSSKLTWDKKRPNKFIHLDEVLAVRSGSDVRQYGIDLNRPEAEGLLFTIIYSVPKKSDSKIMHLITESPDICNVWTKFLDDMLKHRQELMTSLMAFNNDAIAQYWQSEMARQYGDQPRSSGHEELDVAGVKRVCQKLHIYSSQATLEANFHQSDVRRRERLSFSEFMDFLRRMKQRPEIQRIIRSIAKHPEAGITMDEFLDFLRDYQGEDVDSNRGAWEKEFTRLIRKSGTDRSETGRPDGQMMSEAAFIGYVSSKHNGPLVEEPQEYTLDRPMNEYFISSSHNTYLTGRQIAGTSSVEGYISALVQGCRCVEIDCWNGPNGQPKVTHGQTLTSNVSFREVLVVIKKYAFVKTLFPLWISLEVRCSEEQQRVMAVILREVFGSQLIEEPLASNIDMLPSPSQLLEHVLVKVKKPRELQGFESMGRRRGNSLTSPMMRPTVPENTVPAPSQSLPQSPMLSPSHSSRRLASKNRVNTIAEGRVTDLLNGHTSDNDSGSDAGSFDTDNTVKALGQLGVYCAGVKFNGFDTPEAKEFNHIFSFQESTLQKNSRTKEMKMALDLHNMRYLMRVYPDPTRVQSTNFDPLMYWRRGVQMAALNWQSNDVAMQVNRAMFDGRTDSSGYVLKPPVLRNIQVLPFNLEIAGGKKERSVVSFSIDVLSAQQLMRPEKLGANKAMHPYVEVEVFDGRANCIRDPRTESIVHVDNPLKAQTEIVRENAFNPTFNEGQFRFKITTKYPEFIFVKWTVKLSPNGESNNGNSKDIYGIASWTAKLANLRQGYRTIPLENEKGEQYLFSTLFCRIQVDPIAKTMVATPRSKQEVNRLKGLGGKVFGRMDTSPRSSLDRGSVEKTSFESAT
ncbi:1-phosphatidylinositol 4,5-bisphosphate phosphodiesterase-like protein [Hapsidospora chrysogenum ATCC 11550]|uniref:Phosphoinositide phospholipase C n=1 Tax=Hapsidospora chrysogenum (strain ATCC 11550 / CBS 779.69 / DSM 880 / IAM 14645 / JCM 23072 / IMI 49137) TaxID=857340 RepID=A0A086T2R9_HAPC1|nr:1-phosphatidylinositol 4,5-bisphosphate phosphodiesterase-like protein [Hapsidospora chrysogenum ATCC 11550]